LTVLLWSQNVNVIRTHCIGDNIILCKSEIEQHYTINFLNKITSRCRNIKNLKWNITLSNASAAAVYFLTYTLTWIIIVSPARVIYVPTYIYKYIILFITIYSCPENAVAAIRQPNSKVHLFRVTAIILFVVI